MLINYIVVAFISLLVPVVFFLILFYLIIYHLYLILLVLWGGVAGVEPTLVLTATRVCSGLPNVY